MFNRVVVATCTIAYLAVDVVMLSAGCKLKNDGSDHSQQIAQERILKEGDAKVGMPAIHNFREKQLLKEIYEKRDRMNLVTFTYLVAEQTGKLVFLCNSVGYGISAATQYTSPQKEEEYNQAGYLVLPQADPNGLFSPVSTTGTWIMCQDPASPGNVEPVYVEPNVISSPFRLTQEDLGSAPSVRDSATGSVTKGVARPDDASSDPPRASE